MGLKELLEEIDKKGEEDRELLKKKYSEEMEKITTEWEDRLKQFIEKLEKEYAKKEEIGRRRINSRIHLVKSREISKEKSTLLKEIIEEAIEKFLKSKEYLSSLKKKIEEYKGDILIGEKDVEFLKKEHKSSFNRGNFPHGFVVRVKDKEINYTFDVIVKLLYEEFKTYIAQYLVYEE